MGIDLTELSHIAGVKYESRRILDDPRGPVLHFVRADAPGFTTFGEAYFSEVHPGEIKGWYRHRQQTQRYVVPRGRVRIVLFDPREASPTKGIKQEHELGRPDAYALLTIPPGVWYALAAVGDATALIANCADRPHDPADAERASPHAGPVAHAW